MKVYWDMKGKLHAFLNIGKIRRKTLDICRTEQLHSSGNVSGLYLCVWGGGVPGLNLGRDIDYP
jgi:hypothetical protein